VLEIYLFWYGRQGEYLLLRDVDNWAQKGLVQTEIDTRARNEHFHLSQAFSSLSNWRGPQGGVRKNLGKMHVCTVLYNG
jgi:hypothetical protein